MASKVEQVKLLFEQPEWYLQRWRYNIRIRAETVQDFVGDAKFYRILDIGCGDGSISLPLLTSENQLTLLDISSTMLSFAYSQVPAPLQGNVRLINQDFMRAELGPRSYDLILCLGVLVHVASPSDVIAKMARLLKPGGSIVVEYTDSQHVLSYLLKVYNGVLGLVKPGNYAPNAVSGRDLLEMFAKCRFRSVATFRYSFPLPGIRRLFSQETLYEMVRLAYGRYPRARNSWLGNDYIYHLKPTQ